MPATTRLQAVAAADAPVTPTDNDDFDTQPAVFPPKIDTHFLPCVY